MSPTPIQITKNQARKFLTNYHFLYPSRSLDKSQVLSSLFHRLKCIQFDTINVVGRNADLVLQSRVKGYTPEILDQLLYQERSLVDGWDKLASIYSAEDWPYFERHRNYVKDRHQNHQADVTAIKPKVLDLIRENGEMSSIHFNDKSKTDWAWGPTSISRAALESLYAEGALGIHHRVNTRRHFDLIERLLPGSILEESDPNQTLDEYLEWHILRRISSVGLATTKSGEHWLGIHQGHKAKDRNEIISRLIEKQQITPIEIAGLEGKDFFLQTRLVQLLENASRSNNHFPATAAFIAPLDNLIWNRSLISDIFDFSYIWEVYKPKAKREFGYYVLPVLFKENFIGRVDMKFQRKTKELELINWWWEPGIQQTDEMNAAIHSCFQDFMSYLEAESLVFDPNVISANFSNSILKQLV